MVNLSDEDLVGTEARVGCVHPETARAEKTKSEPESFYLTVGRQVMDSRGGEGDSGRREGNF